MRVYVCAFGYICPYLNRIVHVGVVDVYPCIFVYIYIFLCILMDICVYVCTFVCIRVCVSQYYGYAQNGAAALCFRGNR